MLVRLQGSNLFQATASAARTAVLSTQQAQIWISTVPALRRTVSEAERDDNTWRKAKFKLTGGYSTNNGKRRFQAIPQTSGIDACL